MKIWKWAVKHAPTILSWIGAGGVVGTAILSARAGSRSAEKFAELKAAKEERQLTVLDKAKAIAPYYIPTAIVGGGTIACIFGSNVLNKKQQAMLLAAYTACEAAYRNYREKAKKIFGEKGDQLVERAIQEANENRMNGRPELDDTVHFILTVDDDMGFVVEFDSTMYDVLEAEYMINRILALKQTATLNELLNLLGLNEVEYGNDYGWDLYIGETTFGYSWIDFQNNWDDGEDGNSVRSVWIYMPFMPHPLDDDKLNDWFEGKTGGALTVKD